MWRLVLQALKAASQATPDVSVPVLILEDDVRITSFFAMRLTSWIEAIEARRGLLRARWPALPAHTTVHSKTAFPLLHFETETPRALLSASEWKPSGQQGRSQAPSQ